ncbi:MAG TPA: sigma-70 family RNA polymerase sigma factor [Chitinophagaceae bacterium]|nr:sigma-70 family RNA polymerase sigma factor [Chitinophagaceae bacterium]
MHRDSTIHHALEHLFRHESGRLVSILTRVFGPHNLGLAEDVVQDTLLEAMNSWKIRGIPRDAPAWLFTVARNKALDLIRKEKRHRDIVSVQSHLLESEYTLAPAVDELMKSRSIQDDQLSMMFTCCHPSLSAESQVALVLKTLCGFSVAEIAKAFISTPDTIEKRLYRAKEKFRQEKIAFEIPGENELDARLENVLLAIYLLFNEGYNSTDHEDLIRKDLLEESLRLGELLLQNAVTRKPPVYALLALFCFNSARSKARIDNQGNILLLKDQDRNLWDRSLISSGEQWLDKSAEGELFSAYHFEAAISREHLVAKSYDQTNWELILYYYDLLLRARPSPVVALNRAVVIGEMKGPAAGLEAIEKIPGIDGLQNYYLFHAIIGEFYAKLGNREQANEYFAKAKELTSSEKEKQLLVSKMQKE